MEVSRSSDFDSLLELNGSYRDIATVLMNGQGDYLLGSSDFKSENLFRYFYDFNDLTLDERKQVFSEFSSGSRNVFYYKDSRGKDCVYVCTEVPETKWYAVTCVPVASFHSASVDIGMTVWSMLLLLLLMVFNVIWLDRTNRRLRESVQRETVASAAKTDFLSNMSHDIRTPLNVITGSVILAQEEENTGPVKKYLKNIEQSSKFLLSLVNDILDLNKVESGKMELHPEPYSLKSLKESLSVIIAPLCAEKGTAFSITGCESEDAYMLDIVRVNQIFCNILSNSVKFTPAGGHIGLECSAAKSGEGKAELSFRAYDDGEGMSRKFQEHMFEAFSQEQKDAGNVIRGTGLGLAIVNNLVSLMQGSISVESDEGKGTEFRIILPAISADEKEIIENRSEAGTYELNGKRVLLVEDNNINSEIAMHLLENKGMIVSCAANGEEGLRAFCDSREGWFDVILMDIRMPVMNGLEAAAAIRALPRADAKTVRIIAMTANAYDSDVENCIRAGMNAHISKPLDPENMYRTIAGYI